MENKNSGNKKRRKFLFYFWVIWSFLYIGWRIFFTIPIDYGMVSLVCGILLVVSELIGIVEAFSHYKTLSSFNEPKMPKVPLKDYPEIDVFITTHSESAKVLYKTINGCIHMKYPRKEKVHIYLCDDTNRKEMRELAENFNIGYISLKENKSAKAGNINNALRNTKSPLVVTFDADMIPRKEFLMETVPYFFLPKMIEEEEGWRYRLDEEIDEDFKIGFIQTPQSFYNPDLFQYNLYSEDNVPNEQDYFFKEVNVGRNGVNTPIYAGSNTVISREALEEVSGIVEGNITEDFATGIKIQEKGYTCYAIKKVLAHGLAPTDFKNLIKQRQRWGRGCVQTIRSLKFIFGKLSIRGKLSYLTCFLYWWTFFRRLIYILSPILFSVFGIIIVDCTLKELMLIWLPSYLLYNITLKKLSGDLRNQKWNNIIDTIIFPYLIIPIMLETIGIKLKKFNVTDKDKVHSKNTEIKYVIPHIVLLVATIIGVLVTIGLMLKYKVIAGVIILYWLLLNGYFLVMAILFMLSRINYRKEDRYCVREEVEIWTVNEAIIGVTYDLSESGMSVILDKPRYIPQNEIIKLSISTKDYYSEFRGKVIHVNNMGDGYKYSIKILAMSEEDRREYYGIVYDREHTLAMALRSNTIKEIKNNILNRVKGVKQSKRALPRIVLNKLVKERDNRVIKIVDFNYEYVLLDKVYDEKITLNIDGILLYLRLVDLGRSDSLYKIENYSEVLSDKIKLEKIYKFLDK
ncbi:MAG: glycosyltransferase [Clostridium sp.]|uniref:glycosyltransferase n=1 Tax=Clostridium sp. TaxID=1506 RepID=UPI003F403BB3